MKVNNDTFKGLLLGIAISFVFIEILDFITKIFLIFKQ